MAIRCKSRRQSCNSNALGMLVREGVVGVGGVARCTQYAGIVQRTIEVPGMRKPRRRSKRRRDALERAYSKPNTTKSLIIMGGPSS